jgi:aldose 1-epimerase
LEGKEYSLAQNNGTNQLHGGLLGFDKVFWEVKPLENENGIQLSYTSKDGEEGYPGNLSVTVDYVLTDDNTLKVKYQAQTDKTTVINLTQHSYFNLSGDFSKQILDHELLLHADQYLPLDNTQIPEGNCQSVVDTPFDFSTLKTIGRDIEAKNEQLKIGNGYDHCWVINNPKNEIVKAAEVYHPESGRTMDVYTDQPGMQLYTANFLDNTLPSKTGGTYGPRSGFCLETQHFPNAPNEPSFQTTILKPGETFTSETWFMFSVK